MALVPPSRMHHELVELDRSQRADYDIQRLFRLAWTVTIVLVVGAGGWAAASSISGAVVAAGTFVVQGKHKSVQHLDGGVIAAIHVTEGAPVTAGGLLVTLDARELQREITGIRSEIAARTAQVRLIDSELKGLVQLLAKGLVPRTRVATLQREAASISGDIARLEAQQAKVEARLARIEIRASVTGRVHNLLTHTIGGVIPPNATIAEIVPSGDGLVVEIRLAPRDIDQVRAGQPAEVRMTGMNQRTTPSLPARLEQVSADLFRDETRGVEYYLARIALTKGAAAMLSGKQLQPGMPAEVLIQTDRRSVLSYLTKPLRDQIWRAFREE